jgi:ubiquinone/menaquinone biosynthesis C-methylase UbiE
MQNDYSRGSRFASAMVGFAKMKNYAPFIKLFSSPPLSTAKTVVDVGGGWGPVCVALAPVVPDCKFIVQDLPSVVEDGRERIPEELQEKITFMVHDYNEPQVVKGADAYYFGFVFHDNPDQVCVEILRGLIPGELKQRCFILLLTDRF